MKIFFLNLLLAILGVRMEFEGKTLRVILPGYLARNERFVNRLAEGFENNGLKVRR